jgi:hypothetical protein
LYVTKSWGFGVKNYCNMAWLFLFQDLQQRIGKAQHDAGIQAFGVDSGVFAKRKMGPVNQGHGIEKEKFVCVLGRHQAER